MWSSPSDLRLGLERRWDDGSLLASLVGEVLTFPLRLPLKRPTTNELAAKFEDVRAWIRCLEDGSKATLGYGYELQWIDHKHRQLGRNRIPAAVIVPSHQDALRWLGKTKEAQRFSELAAETAAAFPPLLAWISQRPMRLLEHALVWPQVLTVLRWFTMHPKPGLYLRQIDLPGIDTKFIESYRGLLGELIDACCPELASDANVPPGARGFDVRYGLATKPPLLRLRVLDPRLARGGFTDLSAPVRQWQEIDFDVRRVFIIENEINGLCFPPALESAVIFGLGYGLDRLASLPWLTRAEVFYWGDIDTHGFAMLDRVRALLPHVRSLLMNRETLFAHRTSWVTEPSLHTTDLQRLDDAEAALFDDLRRHVHGQGIRLEQERVGYAWLQAALQRLEVPDKPRL